MIENDKVFLDYVNKYTLKNKSPLFWFGSKTALLDDILKLIPNHKIYVEPFAGGASVFFHKKLAELNILNDIDYNLTNFYIQAKLKGKELLKYIKAIPYNIELIKNFYNDLVNSKIENDLVRAVVFFVVINTRFSNGGYTSTIKCHKYTKKYIEKGEQDRDYIDNYYQKVDIMMEAINKLKHCEIYCEDAFEIIRRFDGVNTFFYIDPPYPNSRQKYAKKFNKDMFQKLIDMLRSIKGKFILNCYEEDFENIKNNDKFNIIKKTTIKGNNANDKKTYKTELIIYNYKKEEELFV